MDQYEYLSMSEMDRRVYDAQQGAIDQQTTINAALLNRLAEMQESPYYAAAKYTLAIAEQTILSLEKQLEEFRKGHERYETARRMNPQQWALAWELNISTGKPFDEIIDDLRP